MVSAGKRLIRTSKKANERLVLNAQSSMSDLRSVQSSRNPIEIQGKTLRRVETRNNIDLRSQITGNVRPDVSYVDWRETKTKRNITLASDSEDEDSSSNRDWKVDPKLKGHEGKDRFRMSREEKRKRDDSSPESPKEQSRNAFKPSIKDHKDLLQLVKTSPKFKGNPNENYESWRENIHKYCRMWNLSDDLKLFAVESAVIGEASQFLGINKKWNNVEEIFSKLDETYRMNVKSANYLQSLRQRKDESARVFSARVIYAVNLMKVDQNSEHLKLSSLINGLRSEITRKIKLQ